MRSVALGDAEGTSDSSAEGEHMAGVDDVVSGLLVVAAFASCCVFRAPFMLQITTIMRCG